MSVRFRPPAPVNIRYRPVSNKAPIFRGLVYGGTSSPVRSRPRVSRSTNASPGLTPQDTFSVFFGYCADIFLAVALQPRCRWFTAPFCGYHRAPGAAPAIHTAWPVWVPQWWPCGHGAFCRPFEGTVSALLFGMSPPGLGVCRYRPLEINVGLVIQRHRCRLGKQLVDPVEQCRFNGGPMPHQQVRASVQPHQGHGFVVHIKQLAQGRFYKCFLRTVEDV